MYGWMILIVMCKILQWFRSWANLLHTILVIDNINLGATWLLIWYMSIGRGGQSALRFARLRLEKRHNYVRKVAETAVQMFISNDRPNVSGLVMAGSADFKTELSQSDMFDQVRYVIGSSNPSKFIIKHRQQLKLWFLATYFASMFF